MSQVDCQPTLQEIKLLNWWQVSISPGSWGGNSNLFRWIIKFIASHSQRSRIATSCNCKAPDPPRCSRCGTWSRLLPQDRTETFSFFPNMCQSHLFQTERDSRVSDHPVHLAASHHPKLESKLQVWGKLNQDHLPSPYWDTTLCKRPRRTVCHPRS